MVATSAELKIDPLKESSFSYHMRQTATLAWPIVLSQLSQTLVQVADAIFVGNTGSADALATISFATSFFVIALVAGIGLSMGLSPLVAQARGSGKDGQMLGKLLINSLYLNTFTGIFLALCLLGLVPFLPYFGQDPAVAKLSGPVMVMFSLSLIPIMIYQAIRQWMEGQGKTGPPMWIAVAVNGLNILLNWVFVFGHWGAEPMGVYGSALATLIARIAMIVGMVALLFTIPSFRPHLPKSFRPDVYLLNKLAKLGIPIGLQFFLEVGAFSFAAIMVGWLGAVQQSAHQVAITVASFTYMGASGISSAASVRVGYYYGAGSMAGVKLAARAAYTIGLLYMVVAAVGLLIWHNELPYLFFPDETVAAPAGVLLLFAAFFQLADGAQVVGLGVLRGLGDVRLPTVIAGVAYWLVAMPLAYLLGFTNELGAPGVWIGLSAGLFVAAIALYQRFISLYKRKTIFV